MADQGRLTVSPLVATLLLIAFSFALGAVVLSWGESFVEQRADFVNSPGEINPGCNGVMFELLDIQGQPACLSASGVEFVVDNQGGELVGLQVKLISPDTIRVVENALVEPLSRGATKRVVVPYNGGSLQQVRIVPTVLENGETYCPSQAKVLNNALAPCVG